MKTAMPVFPGIMHFHFGGLYHILFAGCNPEKKNNGTEKKNNGTVPVVPVADDGSDSFCPRADKAHKQRMRLVRPALELRMELYAYKEVLLRNLHRFHQASVRRQAGQAQACVLQRFAVFVGKLVAMAVPLADPGYPVALRDHGPFLQDAGIPSQP